LQKITESAAYFFFTGLLEIEKKLKKGPKMKKIVIYHGLGNSEA
jgi:hypothetical protein